MMDVSVLALVNLFAPGLGTILLGQTKKGIALLLGHIILAILTAVLSYFLIGLLLWPIVILFYVFVVMDGLKVAERLKQGYPVMQGECYYLVSTWFVSFFVTPVFVASNPAKCPQVWKDKMAQYTQLNNNQPAANLQQTKV
jgi:TM2 domain-containing membrane protein YozV